jgi:spoIIIJ-associated protein
MQEPLEIEGKTIDEAIEKACAEFHVPREKLNIEIISEGSAGFLGLGAKKAKIRASLLSLDITLEAETPVVAVLGKPPRHQEDQPWQEQREQPPVRESTPRGEQREPPPAHEAPARREPKEQAARQEDAARREQREQPRHQETPPRREQPEQREQREPQRSSLGESATAEAARPVMEPTGAGLAAKQFLEGLLQLMHLECPVSVQETPDKIILNIEGDGGGLLIGKRGQNLDAIQYIVNKVVNRTASDRKMIIIDTEAYRKRREDSLISLAEKLGEKVKRTRKPVTVGHMHAHDRRVIHLALQNDESLLTKSRGEGEYRKIIIMPAKKE